MRIRSIRISDAVVASTTIKESIVAKRKPVSSYKLFMGIDPGKKGAIVTIDKLGPLAFYKMPEERTDLLKLLRQIKEFNPDCRVVVERVWTRPGSSAVASWTFGQGYGELLMGLTAADLEFTTATPNEWIKTLGLPPRKKAEKKNAWKQRLLAEAERRFGIKLKLWQADALLIADYCRSIHA